MAGAGPTTTRSQDRFEPYDHASGCVADLQSFLTGEATTTVTAACLIEAGLAGYAASNPTALSGPERQELNRARIVMAARHMVTKRVIAALVGAWHAAGIEVLIFKGFALAEFVYQDPTWRSYSDVDIALRKPADGDWPSLTARASAIASELGYEVHGRPEFSDEFDSLHGLSYAGPTILTLFHRPSRTNVDVHSRVVHNCHDESRRVMKQQVITDAVWRDASHELLGDVPVRTPTAVDAALVGLILNRTWSADSSHIRPQDYLDLARLMASPGCDKSALRQRATELGASATLAFFLRRCDPTVGTVTLRSPNAVERFIYDLRLSPEHGNRALAVRSRELRRLPSRMSRALAELPNVIAHLSRWRGGQPATWPGERLPCGDAQLDRDTWRRTQFALRRAFQLCGVRHPERHPDMATAALLYTLRRRGVPVMRNSSGMDTSQAGDPTDFSLTLRGETLWPRGLGIKP